MCARVLKIFMIAGEDSGDFLGGRIIKELKKHSDIDFYGVGGACMETAGLRLLFSSQHLSMMGIVEILGNLLKCYQLYRKTKKAILAYKPDLILSIDAPEFSFPIAKWAQKQGINVHHLVAPSVWAWRPWRARKVAKFLSTLYCLYPFEPQLFQMYGLDARFVGHPLAEMHIDAINSMDFRRFSGLKKDTPLLCVLLGSRLSEVERLAPVFQETISLLIEVLPSLHLVLPIAPHVACVIEKIKWACPTFVVRSDSMTSEKYQAMRACHAALAASGTVTLELALAQVPAVVAYKMHPLTAWIAKFFITTPFVALPNILLKKEVMRECLQEACQPETLKNALMPLLTDLKKRRDSANALKLVKEKLHTSKGPTDIICAHILDAVKTKTLN